MLLNRKLGDYILLRRLAVGGQSEVFLAMKDGPGEFNRPVVIKALPTRYRHDPKFVELFHREAYLSSRFSHPNVVTVHDARLIEGEQCMIMDFISGQTVADIAQRGYKSGEPLSQNHAIRIVADACDGLNYTHDFTDIDETRYPVVHRDVSPQNLMVTYQGVGMVFDFGIAKVEGKASHVDTLAGGKYAYMSPEQCVGDEVDTRSDIFSLGIILYELTAGTRLFRRSDRDEVIRAVTEQTITPPGDVAEKYPPMLEDIVMKALQRDPDARYQNAGKMRDDLRDFLSLQRGKNSRDALGAYVEELFAAEREAVATMIRRAAELDEEPRPKNGTPLEHLGREDIDGEGSDPAVPMPEPQSDEAFADKLGETDAGQEAEAGDSDDDLETDEGRRHFEERMEDMRRKQRRLMVALGILLLVALGLGITSI